MTAVRPTTRQEISAALREARQRTLALIEDLSDEQLMGPRLPIVNPMLWEVGHVAWFHERWVLRQHNGLEPVRADGDSLYDSSAVAHDLRWDLPLPSRSGTLDYMAQISAALLERLEKSAAWSPSEQYFYLLGLLHEDMHAEAFTYTRHTHGWRLPSYCREPSRSLEPVPIDSGDARIAGASFLQGSTATEPFTFDNEKWAHEVTVESFEMSRTQTSIREFALFVDDGGYTRQELWCNQGWAWLTANQVSGPAYWKGETHRWYDQWLSVDSGWPMMFANWFEADAYCRWAGRRLPTESEWELAAAEAPAGPANLDATAGGPVDVTACPETDTPQGVRQLFGNIWEWTTTDFDPYPGFSPDPYEDYSKPWFGTQKVLRGGCWATRSRVVSLTYRNFYEPHRRDVWCGFRTCAQ